jgi:hypothetical protein
MDNLEKELQKLPVEPAPDTLDHRVAKTLQAHDDGHCGALSVRIPLWACAAACLACFAIGMFFRTTPMRPATPAPIVCSIEGGPAFAAVFVAEVSPDDFFLRKKRQINSQNTTGEI